ncbi:GNAT family N-acetyltransferase [Chryseobacterium sp.]|uniref:GNAT family N-acetyltransferase n=1 Tax=Chryseobacterium sp. TaxID=1871047 RepID=UPI0025BEEBDB|nr:GNAT family N-acetyltransferase [Chryseobacterium sp.]MBV8325035.1 GNAT family N-acetyltransferase [Chryseobacterium sp.]
MEIQNSIAEDIDEIFRLYRGATAYMKLKGQVCWPEFSRDLIMQEISERRQCKITVEDKIACIWAVAFDDPQIWQERNADPAVYIHRIAGNPEFKGMNLVKRIADWAKQYALENDKVFVRMDTVGNNTGLISYYSKCGFEFLGLSELKNTEGLPAHYNKATVSLFEIKL